jgi:protein-S-isoprenylcysteine O-methyltransferase Ste14
LLAFNSISKFLKAKTGVVPFSESTTLITEGFYKYTRNPMYVGMNSFLLGLLIILNNPLNFIFLIVFFFIVRNMFVIKEEVQMEETFGEEYLIYKDKVRRWL